MIREAYMNVLRGIDFTAGPLTEAQLDVISRASEEEYAELARWHGFECARATATAEAIYLMWSMLAPWCKTPAGEWRTFGQALRLAPRDVAETVVRRLGELGFDVPYASEETPS
jgi:hypothetical protein